MKAATREEIREIDRASVDEHGISVNVLMENAGRAVCLAAERKFPEARKIAVVCGGGNNGGDGFVAARHLAAKGKKVTVYTSKKTAEYSKQPLENLKSAEKSGIPIVEIGKDPKKTLEKKIVGCDLIIDALLGTGLESEVRAADAGLIDFINASKCPCLSVDVPSGIDSNTGAVLGKAVKADATVTFVVPKVGISIHPGVEHAGEIFVAGITTPPRLEERIACEITTYQTCAGLLHPRADDSHKGTYGHTLVLAGGVGKSGAAVLATEAAVNAGSGLVTLGVPKSVHASAEQKVVEAMSEPIKESDGCFGEPSVQKAKEILSGKSALVTGPGISTSEQTAFFLSEIVAAASCPIVIDADGLNIAAENPGIFDKIRGETVLTPHPAEMARLCGKTTSDIQADRIGSARELAARTGCFVVLKGARTVTACPQGAVFINPTGNPAMASGGMGDVLAGIIGGLLAQGYCARDACILGVFAHGLAGDIAARQSGGVAVRAGAVSGVLSAAFAAIAKADGQFFTVI
ncbi:MAG: NAD(P)H-hydrate dehydratase [Candidatus Mycalebacterium zealandia]|nr:MAG: NAD(P)H-hydrate dehydratase [Candidatus Mycalebacterium zealandia]